MEGEITCFYCLTSGRFSELHSSGWRLAKGRPFAYVCRHCTERGLL